MAAIPGNFRAALQLLSKRDRIRTKEEFDELLAKHGITIEVFWAALEEYALGDKTDSLWWMIDVYKRRPNDITWPWPIEYARVAANVLKETEKYQRTFDLFIMLASATTNLVQHQDAQKTYRADYL